MIRASVVALAALVLLDRFFLDGKYVGIVGAMGRSLVHFVIG
jgi:hypothetical protein